MHLALRARHENVIALWMVGRYSGPNGEDHRYRHDFLDVSRRKLDLSQIWPSGRGENPHRR